MRRSWVPVMTLSGFHFALTELVGDANGRVAIAGSVVPVAWAFFDLAFYIVTGPFFMAVVARRLGLTARTSPIRDAIVWSHVPFAASLVLWIPALLLFGPLAASVNAPDHLALVPFWLAVTVALVWTLVLGVAGVAEVLRIGVWKALAITLIASIPGFIIYGIR